MDDYICLSSLTIRKLFVALVIEFEDTKANSISLKLRRIKFNINKNCVELNFILIISYAVLLKKTIKWL